MFNLKKSIIGLTIVAATTIGVLSVQSEKVPALATNKYQTATHFKYLSSTPATLKGNWYTYTGNTKKHALKTLIIGKNYLSLPTRLDKSGSKYFTKHYTFTKSYSNGHANLIKTDLGWYYYAVNINPNYTVSNHYLTFGIVKPGKIGKQKVLYWYLYNSGATYMKIYTHTKKYNAHQKYTKSTKDTTVLAFPSK